MPWLDNTNMEETLTKTILHRPIKGSTFLDLDATILFFLKSALLCCLRGNKMKSVQRPLNEDRVLFSSVETEM